MSAFVTAMDSTARTVTSNGDPTLKTSSSAGLDLFFKLVRGLNEDALEAMVTRARAEAITPEARADLVVLAFHTRGVRGTGKGEKALAYALIAKLSRLWPEAVVAVLPLLPLTKAVLSTAIYSVALKKCRR